MTDCQDNRLIVQNFHVPHAAYVVPKNLWIGRRDQKLHPFFGWTSSLPHGRRAVSDAIDLMVADASCLHESMFFLTGTLECNLCKATIAFLVFY